MYKNITIVALLVGLFVTAAQAQQDPFLGAWKLNVAKSKDDPGPINKSLTVKREAAGPNAIKVTTDGVTGQGATTHTEYTATLDGKDSPMKGSADYDTVAFKKINANTRLQINKKGGSVARIIRTIVSKDGKSFTSDSVGVNAQGVAFHNVEFFDKQ
jgi:hypothetical protein